MTSAAGREVQLVIISSHCPRAARRGHEAGRLLKLLAHRNAFLVSTEAMPRTVDVGTDDMASHSRTKMLESLSEMTSMLSGISGGGIQSQVLTRHLRIEVRRVRLHVEVKRRRHQHLRVEVVMEVDESSDRLR